MRCTALHSHPAALASPAGTPPEVPGCGLPQPFYSASSTTRGLQFDKANRILVSSNLQAGVPKVRSISRVVDGSALRLSMKKMPVAAFHPCMTCTLQLLRNICLRTLSVSGNPTRKLLLGLRTPDCSTLLRPSPLTFHLHLPSIFSAALRASPSTPAT